MRIVPGLNVSTLRSATQLTKGNVTKKTAMLKDHQFHKEETAEMTG